MLVNKTTKRLPAYWASYLINNDASGLEPEERVQADDYLIANKLPFPVDVDLENTSWGQFNGLGTELAKYTFLT